jgi:hypothetical protein
MPSRARDRTPAPLLISWRDAIEAIVSELAALPTDASDERVHGVIREGLSHGVLEPLTQTRGGVDLLVDQATEEFRRFSPSAASNAADRIAMVRILLLQCLDLLWWGGVDEYADQAALDSDPDLLDLVDERRAGRVAFAFGLAPGNTVARVRDALVQRAFPGRQPRGPGLRYTKVRPAMLGLLNEVAERVTAAAPPGTPRIWVTSITRTAEHQRHLSSLGFSALTPSAHCTGWAADIDAAWFERFDAAAALRTVLEDYLDRGVVNVIDGLTAWHVCLSPDHAARYAAMVA